MQYIPGVGKHRKVDFVQVVPLEVTTCRTTQSVLNVGYTIS
jgi:hypothetical protein